MDTRLYQLLILVFMVPNHILLNPEFSNVILYMYVMMYLKRDGNDADMLLLLSIQKFPFKKLFLDTTATVNLSQPSIRPRKNCSAKSRIV